MVKNKQKPARQLGLGRGRGARQEWEKRFQADGTARDRLFFLRTKISISVAGSER